MSHLDNTFFQKLTGHLEKLAARNPDLATLLTFLERQLDQYLAASPGVPGPQVNAAPSETAEAKKSIGIRSEEINRPAEPAPTPAVEVSRPLPEPPAQPLHVPAAHEPPSHEPQQITDTDVEQLEKRLLLKIEASRWALERDRLIKAKVDFQTQIEPKDHALLGKARELTNCYLWMNNPETAPIVATQNYDLLSDAYASAAMCVAFLRRVTLLVDKMPEHEILVRILRDGLYTAATAQSVLRRVTSEISGRDDQDQIRLHRWLTQLTKKYRIFVNRHMKKDSLASINRIHDIPEVIKRLEEQLNKVLEKQKVLSEGFRRIKFHSAKILENASSQHDWTRVFDTIEEMMKAGVRAADTRFADLLVHVLPLLEDVPAVKNYPYFNHLLLELNFWPDDDQSGRVKQELHAMHYFSNNAQTQLLDEYTNIVWESDQQDLATDDFQERHPGGGQFGHRRSATVVDFVSSTLRNAMSSALDGMEIPDRSSAAAVPESPVDEEASFRSARQSLLNRDIVWIAPEDNPDFRSAMEAALGACVVYIPASVVASGSYRFQESALEKVGIILLSKDALFSDNKMLENFCRNHDKPFLRVEGASSLVQLARQISAAMNLFR